MHKHVSNYALLGLEYIPSNSGNLEININYIKENTINYKSELLDYNEYRYIGLLENYKDEIIDYIRNNLMISGTINIPIAANCEVGSSPNIFRKLFDLLIEYVGSEHNECSDEILIEKMFYNIFK